MTVCVDNIVITLGHILISFGKQIFMTIGIFYNLTINSTTTFNALHCVTWQLDFEQLTCNYLDHFSKIVSLQV